MAFSARGSYFALQSGPRQIAVRSLRGGGVVARLDGVDEIPAWSADGNVLTYATVSCRRPSGKGSSITHRDCFDYRKPWSETLTAYDARTRRTWVVFRSTITPWGAGGIIGVSWSPGDRWMAPNPLLTLPSFPTAGVVVPYAGGPARPFVPRLQAWNGYGPQGALSGRRRGNLISYAGGYRTGNLQDVWVARVRCG